MMRYVPLMVNLKRSETVLFSLSPGWFHWFDYQIDIIIISLTISATFEPFEILLHLRT